jgi:dephospho-CoA kinase
MKKPKLIIAGHARHGKDTVCEILNNLFGYTFQSSSEVAMYEFLYDKLKVKYGYTTPTECFNDRLNHRQEWFQEICDYGKDDLTKLGRLIFSKVDIYCGIRNGLELKTLKEHNCFDYFVWVDASARLPLESTQSMTITTAPDFTVDNNGSLEDLTYNVFTLAQAIEMEKLNI